MSLTFIPVTADQAIEPLWPFREHRTYGAALRAVDRTFRTEGPAAAKALVEKMVEEYQEVFLRSRVKVLDGRSDVKYVDGR